jgi:hypothetical protein
LTPAGNPDTVGGVGHLGKRNPMKIAVEIPDGLADALAAGGKDPARTVVEAVALEAYRQDWLSEYEIQQLLGFETRMEVHGFLKENNVYLHYSVADLEHDIASAVETIERHKAQQQSEPATELHAG